MKRLKSSGLLALMLILGIAGAAIYDVGKPVVADLIPSRVQQLSPALGQDQPVNRTRSTRDWRIEDAIYESEKRMKSQMDCLAQKARESAIYCPPNSWAVNKKIWSRHRFLTLNQ